jgi:hypothetical protein
MDVYTLFVRNVLFRFLVRVEDLVAVERKFPVTSATGSLRSKRQFKCMHPDYRPQSNLHAT